VTRYRVTIDGRVYDVDIDDPRARPVTARLSGTAYSVDVEPTHSAPAADGAAADAESAPPDEPSTPLLFPSGPSPETDSEGPRTMTAPIPGSVTKVVASVGVSVERGGELLTIEAMKMFNVIRSPGRGTVTTVHVKDGDHVVQGQPLVTLTPR
jgi:biotin carboxyl carrier protein